MAGIEMHRHNLDKAKPLYQEAARLDPALAEAQVGLAKILLEQHDPASAEQLLLAAVAQHPDNAEAHYVLMLAYRGQKKMTEAAEQMSIFNRLQTEKDETFQNKMNALLNGKPATAGAPQK
jgi:cytochrome c-type biogenesis protein CcmH/NrfG